MSTSSMSAMVLNRYGEDAPFESATLSRPQVSAGQVVVRIAATSVNTIDTMIRQLGQEELPIAPDLPAVLGMDFAGTIEEVGDSALFLLSDLSRGVTGEIHFVDAGYNSTSMPAIEQLKKQPEAQ